MAEQVIGGAVGMYNKAPEPTLQEAKAALDVAVENVQKTYAALEDNGGNGEVVAFRAQVLTEEVNRLGSAAYDYQRAAYLAAKPTK